MKRILITHTDLDGAGCAIAFKRIYPDIEVRYHDYDTIDEISEEIWDSKDEYDEIYFADITPNPKYGIRMMYDDKFVLIDHHITRAYLKLAQMDNVVYSMNACGAMLSMDYLNMDYDDFIQGIDAYDRWQLDSPYRKYGVDLNLLFNYYGMDEFVARFLKTTYVSSYDNTIINILERIEEDYFVEKLKQGNVKFDRNSIAYFEVHVSEKNFNLGVLVDRADFPKGCKYIKTINLNDGVVGLYSNGFDVSEIAKAHGGGGHTTAAGYQIEFIQKLYI